ncbi:MAG: cell division protein FtsA [Fibrobacteria bacterium]|nr:cell division protein FtsA [Fibrobacteria bacterium]
MSTPIMAIDLGTTKVCALIGSVAEDGALKIMGAGVEPVEGMRKGVIINIDKTMHAVRNAIEQAQLMSGITLHEAYVSICGEHIYSMNSRGVVAVSRADNEITDVDVSRVIDAARAVAIPMDKEIIFLTPRDFIVDDQNGIMEPVGMSGVRLESQIHMVIGSASSLQNIYRSMEKLGIMVAGIAVSPVVSSLSVLDDDEKELGVAVVDIGGGTTDISVYLDSTEFYTSCIGLGGKTVTSDLAVGIRTPLDKAEEIKKLYGSCSLKDLRKDEIINVPGVGGLGAREITRSIITSIIEPRMREIFSLVYSQLQRQQVLDRLGAGLVLTGGCALLEGAAELAEDIFNTPVKVSGPLNVKGIVDAVSGPTFVTGTGLLRYAALSNERTGKSNKEKASSDNMKNIFKKVGAWVKQYV